jgi:hypothetical protein
VQRGLSIGPKWSRQSGNAFVSECCGVRAARGGERCGYHSNREREQALPFQLHPAPDKPLPGCEVLVECLEKQGSLVKKR